MPLINGMKMACEPCIRGHRSTKCNHADERLMVPVRKPGRPLSACPHLKDHMCGCNRVTAAISRKQACQCDSSVPSQDKKIMSKTADVSSSTELVTSPSKPSFRVDKIYQKSYLNKKSSIPNIKRIVKCQKRRNQTSVNGDQTPIISSNGNNTPQFVDQTSEDEPQTQTPHVPLSLIRYRDNSEGETIRCCGEHVINGQTFTLLNQPHMVNSRYLANGETEEIELSRLPALDLSKTLLRTGSSPRERTSCCGKFKTNQKTEKNPPYITSFPLISKFSSREGIESSDRSNYGHSPKRFNHSNISSSGSMTELEEAESTYGYPLAISQMPGYDATPPNRVQDSTQDELALNHQSYPYTPSQQSSFPFQSNTRRSFSNSSGVSKWQNKQNTVCSHSVAAYGSFSNPLDASTWRHTSEMAFSHPNGHSEVTSTYNPLPMPAPDPHSFTQNCICGDTCQCIGCISHPYNEATKNYVRSAWQMMSAEPCSSESYNNNELLATQSDSVTLQQDRETEISLNPPTASSSPINGEEQSLPENDFLFVNYSFPSDNHGNGGPGFFCDDSCQCMGFEVKESNPG